MPRRPKAESALGWLALTLALVSFTHAAWCALVSDQTWDEPYHYEWSRRLVRERVSERETRPYFDSKTPILVPSILVGALGARGDIGPQGSPSERFLLRLPTVLVLGMLYAAAFFLARRWWSTRCASLAVLALALDPNLVAHGSLLTVDCVFALSTLVALYAAVAFWASPRIMSGVALGAAIALAFTAKFSAVLLLPLVLVVPPLCGLRSREAPLRRIFLSLGVAALTGWFLVCASYGFLRLGVRADPALWRSGFVRTLGSVVPWFLSGFPYDFVRGIDVCLAVDRDTQWNSVILFERHPSGVWFYFPLLWLVKTPIPLLMFSVIGISLGIRRIVVDVRARFLLVSWLVFLVYFCFVFRTQVGYRYVLMCLPLGYLLAAYGLGEWRSSFAIPLVLLGVLGCTIEQAPYLGDPLAFTNSTIPSKKDAYRIVADSNLDWRQNDEKVVAWAAAHDDVTLNPVHLVPGRNVVSANAWTGIDSFDARLPSRHGALGRTRRPDGLLLPTHLVFDFTTAEFDAFIEAHRRLAWDSCPLAGMQHARLDVGAHRRIEAGDTVCFVADANADVSVRATSPYLRVVHEPGPELPMDEVFIDGQTPWYRVARGEAVLHVLAGSGTLRVQRGTITLAVGRSSDRALRGTDPVRPLACDGRELTGSAGAPLPLYVRGTFNAWSNGPEARLAYSAGCYHARLPLEAGRHQLKIATADWRSIGKTGVFGSRLGTILAPGQVAPLLVDDLGTPASDIELEIATRACYELTLRIATSGSAEARFTQVDGAASCR